MLYKIDNVSNIPVSQSVTSLNATQISMLSNQRQQEADEERMKKRFSDIEDKIRDALA
jgi:antitoxin component of RelBE/YafQ-DinJ toxin-antitoxin module